VKHFSSVLSLSPGQSFTGLRLGDNLTRFAPALVFTGDNLSHGKSTAHLYLSENAFPCRSRVAGPINAFHNTCARVEHNFTEYSRSCSNTVRGMSVVQNTPFRLTSIGLQHQAFQSIAIFLLAQIRLEFRKGQVYSIRTEKYLLVLAMPSRTY
jgi:hypothetical protein